MMTTEGISTNLKFMIGGTQERYTTSLHNLCNLDAAAGHS